MKGRVIKLFNQVEHGMNPIPSIMCETIHSLNFCHGNKKARFIGCSTLFVIWLVNHLQCYKEFDFPKIRFKDHTRLERRPILEFAKVKWNQGHLSIEKWIELLKSLDVHNIEGKAPCLLPNEFLYRCGDFPWVPLLGLWGAVSHALALACQQIGSNPCILAAHGLLDLEFSYDDGEDPTLIIPKLQKILEAWKSLKIAR